MNSKHFFVIKILALLGFFFIATAGFSQRESVIYIGTNGKLTTLAHAVYMQKTVTKSPKISTVQTFQFKDSTWQRIYSEQYKKLNDSTYQVNGNGGNIPATTIRTFVRKSDESWKFRDVVKKKVFREGYAKSVMPLLFHGQVTEYYPSGSKKSVSEYSNNELVSNENWYEIGDKYIDNIFYSTDTEPTFNSGMTVLHQHILKGFKDAKIDVSAIKGSMIVGFVVMENGTIDGIKIVKGLAPGINSITYNSFMTLSLKGKWTPAKLNNQPVRYYQLFPINFLSNQSPIKYVEVRHEDLHYGFD